MPGEQEKRSVSGKKFFNISPYGSEIAEGLGHFFSELICTKPLCTQ